MDGYIVQLDLVECIRCGICVELCPSIFAWGEGGFIIIRKSDFSPFCLKEAIYNCPVSCIKERR